MLVILKPTEVSTIFMIGLLSPIASALALYLSKCCPNWSNWLSSAQKCCKSVPDLSRKSLTICMACRASPCLGARAAESTVWSSSSYHHCHSVMSPQNRSSAKSVHRYPFLWAHHGIQVIHISWLKFTWYHPIGGNQSLFFSYSRSCDKPSFAGQFCHWLLFHITPCHLEHVHDIEKVHLMSELCCGDGGFTI